jgi:hypothetical protein
MTPSERDSLNYTRRRVQRQLLQAERERREKLYRHRMQLVSSGVKAVKKKDYAEALKSFQSYLLIMEELKDVSRGGLTPGNFDKKKELPELVLISGIYWDLAKIYDHSRPQYAEFVSALEKFVVFSKNMPYEAVCTELVRKYLRNEKPSHAKEFRDTYRRMSGHKCFVVGALIDEVEPETPQRMRAFRDKVLLRSWPGRLAVRAYYLAGPGLAWVVERLPSPFRRRLGRAVDGLSRRLSAGSSRSAPA